MTNLELKVSASLKQALDKLKLSSGNEKNKGKIFVFYVVIFFCTVNHLSNRDKSCICDQI